MKREIKDKKRKSEKPSSAAVGAIALVFLIIGYQTALVVHKAAVTSIIAHRDAPDTIYVYGDVPIDADSVPAGAEKSTERNKAKLDQNTELNKAKHEKKTELHGTSERKTELHEAKHDQRAQKIADAAQKRKVETFPFDPNTVSISDLKRLGFTEKQAIAIDNYRQKGGRYKRKADFAKSFVVSDSIYRRLEAYICIPKIDINSADSADFDALPGIGPWYAAKMVEYRSALRGYSYPEQLMEIYHFDKERFDALSDLITVGPSEAYPLWELSEEELAEHPYISRRTAHSIILYRENSSPSQWTVENMLKARAIDSECAKKLSKIRIDATASTQASAHP